MPEPDLADLDAFAAVARARSFRRAASLRGVSASGLSEAVRRLEARLGLGLLVRTTRSVTPTEAGARLLARLSPALGEVRAALDEIEAGRGVSGTLRLNVPGAVARLVLPGLLPRFMAAHPALSVEIAVENGFLDVFAAGFDAGIRYDERLERDMIAVPIGPREQRYATAAAPGFLAVHGTPAHPRDLLRLPCLRHRFESGVVAAWEFEKAGETLRLSPDGPLVTQSIEVRTAAAVAGLGLIQAFEGFMAAELADGRLVEVLAAWAPRFAGPFLYYPSRRHMAPALRAFVDFVKAEGAA
ncbi:LysR substrate-binding domain-containing protein [Falsiroseomonas sp. HW251]|uniref:LysR substrate-binding domain-containing protein n=1 Tax=Falsiroseomonas sp. HW251 TaxID=3390998 RepID=UPI003D31AE4F